MFPFLDEMDRAEWVLNALDACVWRKGGPELESRTGSRLVSPATGHEKKKWSCHQNDSWTVGFDADAPKGT